MVNKCTIEVSVFTEMFLPFCELFEVEYFQ